MKIKINKLIFECSKTPFGAFPKKIDSLKSELKLIGGNAGTSNEKFNRALSAVNSSIENNESLADILDEPIKVRVLAILLQKISYKKIHLTKNVFIKIDQLRPTPSALLLHSLYQHYLSYYDLLEDPVAVATWLLKAMKDKRLLKDYHENIFSESGPKWIAEQCIANDREFLNELVTLGLENYSSGRFLSFAKKFYYIEQLKVIPVNQPAALLSELQKQETYDSRYDENYLLGHKILQILIERAPDLDIDDSWLNVVMSIAGDPRVPTTHPNHQKWWSRVSVPLKNKVQGWLSKLDLRLFLEALKNYSLQQGNSEIKRMFPSRKKFLEGLLDKELITNTRLYLASGAESYLLKNYKPEHLTKYSTIKGDPRSIIHVQLGEVHLIEGSHSCYLWIYPKLDPSAIVFDYAKTNVFYDSLTGGMSLKMKRCHTPHKENITHSPVNFSWQRKAINTLNSIGVKVSPEDILSKKDYSLYIRQHGVEHGLH